MRGNVDSSRSGVLNSDEDRKSLSFPHLVPIRLSHDVMPTTGEVMRGCGMAFGGIVVPFMSDDNQRVKRYSRNRRLFINGNGLARCVNCAGYINAFCDISLQRWFCALCGQRNPFQKHQKRYKQVDLRMLPEYSDALADYAMPLFDVEDPMLSAKACRAPRQRSIKLHTNKVNVDRPLVQVFLVQESMRPDTLHTTIEAISATVSSLHPDIEVVLLTYSNRLGIYRFIENSSESSIEYIHFMDIVTKKIFEGYENHEFFATDGISMLQTVQAANVLLDSDRIVELMPISSFRNFLDLSMPIGLCRGAFISALNSIYDTCSMQQVVDELMPQRLIGPALQAIREWITEPIVNTSFVESEMYDISEWNDDSSKPESTDVFSMTGMLTALFGSSSDRHNKKISLSTSTISSADYCSAVILNVFLDSPQDLPRGYHRSVGKSHLYSGKSATNNLQEAISSIGKIGKTFTTPNTDNYYDINSDWIKELSKCFSQKNVVTNIWAVVNYESDVLGLASLEPLAVVTSGCLNRVVLGINPKDERTRFIETMRRCLLSKIATRGILKFRGSPKLNFSSFHGCCYPDLVLPNVYRLPCSSPETAFAFYLDYSNNSTINNQDKSVAVQLAYSYECLEEECDPEVESDQVNLEGQYGIAVPTNNSYSSSTSDRQENITIINEKRSNYYTHIFDVIGLGEEKRVLEEVETTHLNRTSNTTKKKKISNASNSSNLHTFDRSSQYYDMNKNLVVGRYLRTFTIVIECSSNVERVQQSCHVPTTISLLLRSSLQSINSNMKFVALSDPLLNTSNNSPSTSTNDYENRGRRGDVEDISSTKSTTRTADNLEKLRNDLQLHMPCQEILYGWCLEILLNLSETMYNDYSRKVGKTNAKKQLDVAHEKAIVVYLRDLFVDENSTVHNLLKVLFLSIDWISSLMEKNSSVVANDALCEQFFRLKYLDGFNAFQLICPTLLGITHDNLLLNEQLILSRSAIVSTPYNKFLLKTSDTIIIYHSAVNVKSDSISATEKDFDYGSVGKKTAVCGPDELSIMSDSGELLKYSAKLLDPRHLIHRLSHLVSISTIVPQVIVAEAGKSTASDFSRYLLDDQTSTFVTLNQFFDLLLEDFQQVIK